MTMAGGREAAMRGTPEEKARARKIRRRALRQCERWLEAQAAWLIGLDWELDQGIWIFYARQWANEAAALERLRQIAEARFWIAAEGEEPWVLLEWELEQWRLRYLARA